MHYGVRPLDANKKAPLKTKASVMNRFFMNLAAALLLVLSLEAGDALSSAHLTSLTPAAGVKRVKIKKITLELPVTKLPKESNTTLTLTALYDDNSTEDVTGKAEWIITPKDAVTINGRTLTAKLDTNVTIQAKLNATRSNPVTLEIYWEVNGHRLPPEPDPKINNATLLGVDVNNNGVRDDVERWIYKMYSHPIERALLMQNARYEQSILENYSAIVDRDNKILKELNVIEDNYLSCMFYWKRKHINENFQLSIYSELEGFQHKYFSEPIKKIQRNTIERINARDELEKAVSGGVYSLPEPDKSKCDFNATELMESNQ